MAGLLVVPDRQLNAAELLPIDSLTTITVMDHKRMAVPEVGGQLAGESDKLGRGDAFVGSEHGEAMGTGLDKGLTVARHEHGDTSKKIEWGERTPPLNKEKIAGQTGAVSGVSASAGS
jgi:hypothetical protein